MKCEVVSSLECPGMVANYFSVSCFIIQETEILMIPEVQTMLLMLSDYYCITSEKGRCFPGYLCKCMLYIKKKCHCKTVHVQAEKCLCSRNS